MHYLAHPVTGILLLALGCGGGERTSIVTRVDSAGIRIVESAVPAWGSYDGWSVSGPTTVIGTVDGSPEEQLYRVRGATRMEDGRIAVANSGSFEIRIYTANGRWLQTLGAAGDGPGEFRQMRGLQRLPADTLLVADYRGPRVTLFSGDGALVGERRLASLTSEFNPPDYRLPDGRWLDLVLSPEIEGYQRRHNTFVAWSDTSSNTDSLLAFAGAEYLIYFRYRGDEYVGRGAISVPFGGQDVISVGARRVALSDGRAFDIAVASLDGQTWRIRRGVQRQEVAGEDVARFVDDYVSRYPPERQREVREHYGAVSAPSLMPTHSAIILDRLDNLWVEHYRRPWDDVSPRVWSVFDREGRWLGELEVPDAVQILEIGDNYILGLERDELDVEYVTLYDLRKP